MKFMKGLLLSCCMLMTSQAIAQMKVSDNVEVYAGEANLTVTIVRVLPLESKQALIKISGIDNPVSNIVLLNALTIKNDQRQYKTTLFGRKVTTFFEKESWGTKTPYVWIHGKKDSASLKFDSESSKETKSNAILMAYEDQLKSGRQKTVQEFDRSSEEKAVEQKLQTLLVGFEKSCGTKLPVEIQWSSISDELIKSISVGSYCGEVISTLKSMCGNSNPEYKKWIKTSITAAQCSFGDKLKLKLSDKALKFQTSKEGSNQRDFIKYNILNLM